MCVCVCVCVCVFPSWICCPLRCQSSPQTRLWEGFLVFGNLLYNSLMKGSPSLTLLSFYLLYFALPHFKENGLPFWVPGVLHKHSEVVLWNLFSVQMIFQWLCWGESGLPILFLCHLRTTSYCALMLKMHFLKEAYVGPFFLFNLTSYVFYLGIYDPFTFNVITDLIRINSI